MLNLLIAGDLVPTQSNETLFCDGDIATLIGEDLLQIWNKADFRCCNLETALINEGRPIIKAGPNLKSSTQTVKGIKDLNLDAICLANNHIKDFGDEGIASTVKLLDESKIPWFGVGNNINSITKYHIFEKDGLSVGIYACAEHEFSIADDISSGANPYNDYYTNMDIRELKTKVDKVIVLYHGGREHYRYPSPMLQKRCRLMADNGADCVICQHSHCIGCYEEYNNSTIIYGQGNFIFDYRDYDCWQTSLVVSVTIDKSESNIKVEYLPILKNGNTIKLADEQNASEIMKQFNVRSAKILEPGFINEEYKKEAQNAIDSYMYCFYNGQVSGMINYIECEAHNEIVLYALKNCKITPNTEKKVSILQKIFSVRNQKINGVKKKVITILGIKIIF